MNILGFDLNKKKAVIHSVARLGMTSINDIAVFRGKMRAWEKRIVG